MPISLVATKMVCGDPHYHFKNLTTDIAKMPGTSFEAESNIRISYDNNPSI